MKIALENQFFEFLQCFLNRAENKDLWDSCGHSKPIIARKSELLGDV